MGLTVFIAGLIVARRRRSRRGRPQCLREMPWPAGIADLHEGTAPRDLDIPFAACALHL
jgi:hypothetical protein